MKTCQTFAFCLLACITLVPKLSWAESPAEILWVVANAEFLECSARMSAGIRPVRSVIESGCTSWLREHAGATPGCWVLRESNPDDVLMNLWAERLEQQGFVLRDADVPRYRTDLARDVTLAIAVHGTLRRLFPADAEALDDNLRRELGRVRLRSTQSVRR